MIVLQNAKDIGLDKNPGTLPNMQSTITDWFQPMTFTKVTKTVVDHEVSEALEQISFMGVRQPLSPRQLMMKPEGQRAWRWEQIHAEPSVQLVPDDIIMFNNIKYRVMAKLDYTEYGYTEMHLTQDYQK